MRDMTKDPPLTVDAFNYYFAAQAAQEEGKRVNDLIDAVRAAREKYASAVKAVDEAQAQLDKAHQVCFEADKAIRAANQALLEGI